MHVTYLHTCHNHRFSFVFLRTNHKRTALSSKKKETPRLWFTQAFNIMDTHWHAHTVAHIQTSINNNNCIHSVMARFCQPGRNRAAEILSARAAEIPFAPSCSPMGRNCSVVHVYCMNSRWGTFFTLLSVG